MATFQMDTSFQSNDYRQDVFSKNDVILYAKRLENELKRVQSQNDELQQQLNQMETENRSKDELLNEASDENMILQHEMAQLRRQSRVPSRNKMGKITPSGIAIETKPRAYSMNAMTVRSVSTRSISSQNTINTIHEDKGPKIISGYMFKKGKFDTELQNRFFVLYANNTLSYYQDASDEDDASLGEICLYSVYDIKEEPNNYIFHLITAKTMHTLRCDLEEDYNRWTQIIKSIVSPKILCKGWLYKKGDRTGNTQLQWKHRYFALCQLMDYAQHYEVRYYLDEKCKSYKGNINCDEITDIKLTNSNASIQKYGKDKVLELVTENRVHVISANNTQTRNSWYKSLKKVLFDGKQSRINCHSPSHLISPLPAEDHDVKSKPIPPKRSGSKKRPSFIHILQPISEHIPFHPKTPNNPVTLTTSGDVTIPSRDPGLGLVLSSDNNQDIDTNEWRHCFASISPQITPCISPAISPSISPSGSPRRKLCDSSKYHIRLSPSDTEDTGTTPLVSNLSKDADAEALLAKAMMPLRSAKRTFSNESESDVYPLGRGRGSSQSSPWSYMSNNSVLLMDINSEYNRLGQLINDFDTKSTEMYDKMSYDQAKGCELIINSPFEFFSDN